MGPLLSLFGLSLESGFFLLQFLLTSGFLSLVFSAILLRNQGELLLAICFVGLSLSLLLFFLELHLYASSLQFLHPLELFLFLSQSQPLLLEFALPTSLLFRGFGLQSQSLSFSKFGPALSCSLFLFESLFFDLSAESLFFLFLGIFTSLDRSLQV